MCAMWQWQSEQSEQSCYIQIAIISCYCQCSAQCCSIDIPFSLSALIFLDMKSNSIAPEMTIWLWHVNSSQKDTRTTVVLLRSFKIDKIYLHSMGVLVWVLINKSARALWTLFEVFVSSWNIQRFHASLKKCKWFHHDIVGFVQSLWSVILSLW